MAIKTACRIISKWSEGLGQAVLQGQCTETRMKDTNRPIISAETPSVSADTMRGIDIDIDMEMENTVHVCLPDISLLPFSPAASAVEKAFRRLATP